MAELSRETPQEGTGRKPVPTFPGEAQGALFAPKWPSFTSLIGWLVRGNVKQVAARIYGGDVDQASDNLYRILEGRHKRHFSIDWLTFVFEEVPEAGEAFLFHLCDRLGYERPARKPDPVRVQEELAAVRKQLEQATQAVGLAAEQMRRLETKR